MSLGAPSAHLMTTQNHCREPTLTIDQADGATNHSTKPASEQVAGYLQQAIACHRQGQLQEAERLYRDILQIQPDHPDANHNLGVLAVQAKQPMGGLPHFKAALEAQPEQGQYWLSYIDALIQAGQADAARQVLVQGRQRGLQGEAVEALAGRLESSSGNEPSSQEMETLAALFNEGRYTEAELHACTMTTLYPRHDFGWKVLGAVFKKMGRSADALAPMQKVVALSPNDAEGHTNLGTTLHDLGRLVEAETSYRRALEIKPDYAEVHTNLGVLLKGQGHLVEAEASYRRALEIKPDLVDSHFNLGNVLQKLGRFAEAEISYRQALEIRPDFAEAHGNLGIVLKDQGRYNVAEASYRHALELKPNFIEMYINLGIVLQGQGRLDEAEASYRRALEIKPDFAEAHSNLGVFFHERGRLVEAEASYRRALESKPDFAEAHSNLIFALDMMADEDTVSLQEERKRWNESHAAHLLRCRAYANTPDPERRLRIGYVSADFRTHSAAFVFGVMLCNFDYSLFDVVAYSNSTQVDAVTHRFQQSVTCWRTIYGLTDDVVADLIQQDEIDILVDLSGHSRGNRLLVFARKPAPIQITAWGYASSTGLNVMDVFFADLVTVPLDEKSFYTEEVRYLPNIVSAFFPQAFPQVNTLPALSTRGITFGSFNRLVKVSDGAYQTWAQVLRAVPNSRMVLKTGELGDAGMRARVSEHFTKAGVDPARITLLGKTSWRDHVAAFSQIDVTLDPFPHGGGVTTLEGLMMGVPVISLRWPTIVGRTTASILTTLGLSDWIAETPEQYVEIAVKKARDLTALAELRQQLRSCFTASIIGNAEAYVRAVEQEYRQLWREWCGRQK